MVCTCCSLQMPPRRCGGVAEDCCRSRRRLASLSPAKRPSRLQAYGGGHARFRRPRSSAGGLHGRVTHRRSPSRCSDPRGGLRRTGGLLELRLSHLRDALRGLLTSTLTQLSMSATSPLQVARNTHSTNCLTTFATRPNTRTHGSEVPLSVSPPTTSLFLVQRALLGSVRMGSRRRSTPALRGGHSRPRCALRRLFLLMPFACELRQARSLVLGLLAVTVHQRLHRLALREGGLNLFLAPPVMTRVPRTAFRSASALGDAPALSRRLLASPTRLEGKALGLHRGRRGDCPRLERPSCLPLLDGPAKGRDGRRGLRPIRL